MIKNQDIKSRMSQLILLVVAIFLDNNLDLSAISYV